MRQRTVAAIGLGLLALAGSARAETPLLEEFMREYTFLMIFLSLVGAVAGFVFLWASGMLPQALLQTWAWLDERFALRRYASLARREYYSVVFTLLPASGRTFPQSSGKLLDHGPSD